MPDVRLPLLSSVQIASPCPAKWEEMAGDDRTRHCSQCDLDVHNLSEMTAPEAEAFLRERPGGGRVCGRIFRRVDGTILTRDCPVGIALWRKRARFAAGRVAAAVFFLATGGWLVSAKQRDAYGERLRVYEPFKSMCAWMNPTASAPVAPALPFGSFVMGDFGGPIPPSQPSWVPMRANGSPYLTVPEAPPEAVEPAAFPESQGPTPNPEVRHE